MEKTVKILVFLILIIFFTLIFFVLDFGFSFNHISQVIQPLIFATTAAICILYPYYKKPILFVSQVPLFLMIVTYLIKMLDFSNWIGSLGFGMLFITIFSYLPQIFKKGYIEKF